MTLYINKGKRKFIIEKDGAKLNLLPLEVVELNEKEYEKLKNFKEIQVLQAKKPENKKTKNKEIENKEIENKELQETNGNNK